jgi:hypothetical protein
MSGASKNQMSPSDTTEQEGFEPSLPVGKSVFKTDAINRSATAPGFNANNQFIIIAGTKFSSIEV